MNYKDILLEPIKIGTRICVNRFFIQPMECSDADTEGNPSELTYKRYEDYFRGQAGLIDLEAITITGESRSRLQQLEIMPRNAKALKKFVSKMKEINSNALFIFQLTHSGELSNPNFSRRVTVKPLHGFGGEQLSEEEVDKIIDQFVLAAKIAHDAGADGIDMKFCHGYLGSQVLRPYNDRKWKYGGPWENRSRFAFDLYERIQREVNDKNFLIGSKVSMWEGFPGGFGSAGPDTAVIDMTEPISLLKGLEERGAQYFIETLGNPSVSISLLESDKDHTYLSYLHTHFADVMKKSLKPETTVIGSHFSVFRNGKNNGLYTLDEEHGSLFAYGAKCINDGNLDMVGLGRQAFADPYLPLKLKEGREDEIKYCTACLNCLELMIQQKPIGCAVYNKYYTDMLLQTRKERGKTSQKHT